MSSYSFPMESAWRHTRQGPSRLNPSLPVCGVVDEKDTESYFDPQRHGQHAAHDLTPILV